MKYLQQLKEPKPAIETTKASKENQEQQSNLIPIETEPTPVIKAGTTDSPANDGMIQCKACQSWQYSQCRKPGFGSADPQRWRRCKGFTVANGFG